jgi:MerR HTH family regulatory protein
MKELLRKIDVVKAVGAPKSTVSDWINDYPAFIPTIKDGSSTYYKPEAIDVLLYIKELRELNYAKPEIASKLVEKGFAINADEVTEQLVKTKERAVNSDALNAVMTTMGKFLEKSIAQDGRITELEKAVRETESNREETAAALLERFEKQDEEIRKLRSELEEERKKSVWQRLFGK